MNKKRENERVPHSSSSTEGVVCAGGGSIDATDHGKDELQTGWNGSNSTALLLQY